MTYFDKYGWYIHKGATMINLDLELAYQDERRKDMMRKAEKRRLVKAILAARPRPNRFYAPVLVGLGRLLTGWGLRLQARYGSSC
jgi:hypothetical protein